MVAVPARSAPTITINGNRFVHLGNIAGIFNLYPRSSVSSAVPHSRPFVLIRGSSSFTSASIPSVTENAHFPEENPPVNRIRASIFRMQPMRSISYSAYNANDH
jgi:hypothetical protein